MLDEFRLLFRTETVVGFLPRALVHQGENVPLPHSSSELSDPSFGEGHDFRDFFGVEQAVGQEREQSGSPANDEPIRSAD